MDIKNKIRQIRESKGLTQEDIADKLGVTRANYRYFENRGNKLTIEQLESIAKALDVAVSEVLGISTDLKDTSKEVEQLRKRNEELEIFNKRNNSLINSYERQLLDYLDITYFSALLEMNLKTDDGEIIEGEEVHFLRVNDENIEKVFNEKIKYDTLAMFIIENEISGVDSRLKTLLKKYHKLGIMKKHSEHFTLLTYPKDNWVKLKD